MFNTKKDFIIKIFLRLFFVFLISLIPVVWVIQNDRRVQLLIQNKVVEILQKEWKSKIQVESSDVNLFTGNILLRNGIVQAINSLDFEWKFKIAKIRFSRLDYIFKNKMVLKIEFENIKAQTVLKKSELVITDHLKNVLSPSTIFDVDLKSVGIKNLSVDVFYNCPFQKKLKKFFLDLPGNFVFKKKEKDGGLVWEGELFLEKGKGFFQDKLFLQNLKGEIHFLQNDLGTYLNAKKEFDFLSEHYFLDARIDKDLLINIKSHGFAVKVAPAKQNDLSLTGTIPFKLVTDVINFYQQENVINSDFKGGCNFDLTLNSSHCAQGNVEIKTEDLEFMGKGFYNLDKQIGRIFLSNSKDIIITQNGSWVINPQHLGMDFNLDQNLSVTGKYKLILTNKTSVRNYLYEGNYFFKDKYLNLSGKRANSSYLLQVELGSQINLHKFLYTKGGEKLITILPQKKNSKDFVLIGKIRYSFIKDFLPAGLGKNLLGKSAILFFRLDQQNNGYFSGVARLGGGKLFVLGNYNPIEKLGFDFDLDVLTKKIILTNLKIDFFKGKICAPKTVINLTQSSEIESVYVPIEVDDVLLNWKKDFYALIYGNLLISKKLILDQPTKSGIKISGDLVLKRSLLKGDFFSQNGGNDIFESYFISDLITQNNNIVEFDINLINEKPTKIKTSFLQTDANLDLKLHAFFANSRIQKPQISGNIDLQKGELSFLKHKLYVRYGKIQFSPNQISDSLVDLFAENKIKKYFVNLQVAGSLLQPTITMQASPELREEEILALLIAGSEDASLQTELPTFLIQNLNDLILSNKNLSDKTSGFLRKIIIPFKYVQITPDFTNQSASGLKGTVSIDLNKQIHAQIQKNFNLQDDLAFQVEYFLTDNINFKMVKDQSGELGGQVEVRLKL